MKDEIPISVVMSLYNTPVDYLRESIESIINQTYKNYEFIIIDDGASQQELDVLKEFKDERIKVYHNESNIGLEKSLNKGIELAKYDYIIRMDTDDIAYPERFEKQVDFIIKHKEYALVGSRVDIFNDKDGIYSQTKRYGEIKKENLLKGPPFVHPSLIINKEILKRIGGYPLYKRCEDYGMELKMYCNGYKGYVMKDILLKYRVVNSYKKRTMEYRMESVKLRKKYFKKLKIKWYQYAYILKPLLSGKIFWLLKSLINKIKVYGRGVK